MSHFETPGEAWCKSSTSAIRAVAQQVERCAQGAVLEVPFDDIDRMEEAASDLHVQIGRLRKARGLALERLYLAGAEGEPRE